MWLATNKKFKNMCALEMSYKPDLSHAELQMIRSGGTRLIIIKTINYQGNYIYPHEDSSIS